LIQLCSLLSDFDVLSPTAQSKLSDFVWSSNAASDPEDLLRFCKGHEDDALNNLEKKIGELTADTEVLSWSQYFRYIADIKEVSVKTLSISTDVVHKIIKACLWVAVNANRSDLFGRPFLGYGKQLGGALVNIVGPRNFEALRELIDVDQAPATWSKAITIEVSCNFFLLGKITAEKLVAHFYEQDRSDYLIALACATLIKAQREIDTEIKDLSLKLFAEQMNGDLRVATQALLVAKSLVGDCATLGNATLKDWLRIAIRNARQSCANEGRNSNLRYASAMLIRAILEKAPELSATALVREVWQSFSIDELPEVRHEVENAKVPANLFLVRSG
jgi:hypothetical protein